MGGNSDGGHLTTLHRIGRPIAALLAALAAVSLAPYPQVSGSGMLPGVGGVLSVAGDSLLRSGTASGVAAAAGAVDEQDGPLATSFSSPLKKPLSEWAGFGFGECNPAYENRHHLGLDSRSTSTATGTPVFAAAAGMVRYSTEGTVGGYGSWVPSATPGQRGTWSRGHAVVIEHHLAHPRSPEEEWVTTLYGHVQSGLYDEEKQIGLVPSGTVVRQGQYIARVADYVQPSGTNAHHLHFGIRLGRYGVKGTNYTQGYGPVCDEAYPDRPWDRGAWRPPVEFLAAHTALPTATPAVDWPMFKGDITRSGVSASRAIANPQIVWKQSVGIQGYLNNPVIVGDRVFVGSSGDRHNVSDDADGVYCLDLMTGARLWFAHANNDVNGVAAGAGLVVATGDEGAAWALVATTGATAWRRELGGGKVYTNPLLLGELAIVGDGSGDVSALQVATGAIKWRSHLDGAIRGGASSDGKAIYVASQGGEAVAMDLEGRDIWRTRLFFRYTTNSHPQVAQVYPAPTVAGDVVVLGYRRDSFGDDPALIALDTKTGTVRWPTKPPEPIYAPHKTWGNVRSSAAYFKGLLIHAEAYSNRIEAESVQDGHVVWSTAAGSCQYSHWASPAIAGGVALVPREDGGLYALDAARGILIWHLFLGRADLAGPDFPEAMNGQDDTPCGEVRVVGQPILASPAVARNGYIIVGTEEGYVYCIGDKRW